LKAIWQNKVVPFLEATRYQGVRVDGGWAGLDQQLEDDPENEESKKYRAEFNLFIHQRAHNLTGSLLFRFENNEKKFSLDFNVTGYIWEGYLTLNFTPKDKKLTSYATSLVKLHSGGETLVGKYVFRNVEQEFVSDVPLFLSRASSS